MELRYKLLKNHVWTDVAVQKSSWSTDDNKFVEFFRIHMLFIAWVINLPCIFTHYWELLNFYDLECRMLELFNPLSPVDPFCECCRMSLL